MNFLRTQLLTRILWMFAQFFFFWNKIVENVCSISNCLMGKEWLLEILDLIHLNLAKWKILPKTKNGSMIVVLLVALWICLFHSTLFDFVLANTIIWGKTKTIYFMRWSFALSHFNFYLFFLYGDVKILFQMQTPQMWWDIS